VRVEPCLKYNKSNTSSAKTLKVKVKCRESAFSWTTSGECDWKSRIGVVAIFGVVKQFSREFWDLIGTGNSCRPENARVNRIRVKPDW